MTIGQVGRSIRTSAKSLLWICIQYFRGGYQEIKRLTKSLAVSAPRSKELDKHQILGVDGGFEVLGGKVEDIRVSVDTSHHGGGSKTNEGNSSRETHDFLL